jgi:hypothetical protein
MSIRIITSRPDHSNKPILSIKIDIMVSHEELAKYDF